jgi:hypothetical protein
MISPITVLSNTMERTYEYFSIHYSFKFACVAIEKNSYKKGAKLSFIAVGIPAPFSQIYVIHQLSLNW